MSPFFLLLLLSLVRGVVLDPTGRPVDGAKIACGTETFTTDSRGVFEFQKPCVATIEKSGFAPKTVALTDGKETRITLALASLSDRVLVTASAAPVAMDEAGVAANVFTATDLTARQFPFIEDLLRDVPGLSVVQTGRNGGLTSLFARGGDSDTAMVLLDGIPITDPGGNLDFAHLSSTGLDRVEVVRGPESALYGAEGSSAVIQLFTQHGDVESQIPHGQFLYERGSFSTDHWSGTLAGGLAKRLDYALTADQFRSTGEFENDAYRITTGTADIGYHFTDTTILRAAYREFDSYIGVPGQVFYSLTDTAAFETVRDSALSVRLDDARGKRFTQKVIFGYHRNSTADIDNSNPNDTITIAALTRTVPGPVPYTYLISLVPATTTIAPPGTSLSTYTYYPYPYNSLTVSDRTNAQYHGTVTHQGGALSFGYEYERQAGDVSGLNVSRFDNGLFISDQYAVAPRIFLTASARYQQSSTFGSEFAPRGAVTFRLPTETFLRFSASRGIKEPSLLENFVQAGYYVGNPALKPETTESYELGLSREWLSRLRTELSVFRNSFHDLIEYDSAVYPGTWQNVDRAWARGAELSASFRVTHYLAVRGAYTKLYTKITNSATPGEIGEELLRRPKNSGSVAIEVTPKKWMVIVGARFVGERQDEDYVFGVNRNPGYQYVFGDASYQATRHFAPFVRVQNALDQQYQEALGYSALSRSETGGLRITW